MKDGRMQIHATSDSAIVAGLIAMLVRVYSGRRPADILSTPPEFIRRVQLEDHLSPTRSNGLSAMVQQIRQMAVAALAQQHKTLVTPRRRCLGYTRALCQPLKCRDDPVISRNQSPQPARAGA
jgi:hypothetical protein